MPEWLIDYSTFSVPEWLSAPNYCVPVELLDRRAISAAIADAKWREIINLGWLMEYSHPLAKMPCIRHALTYLPTSVFLDK